MLIFSPSLLVHVGEFSLLERSDGVNQDAPVVAVDPSSTKGDATERLPRLAHPSILHEHQLPGFVCGRGALILEGEYLIPCGAGDRVHRVDRDGIRVSE